MVPDLKKGPGPVRDLEIFLGPGPVRGMEVTLDPGPVLSLKFDLGPSPDRTVWSDGSLIEIIYFGAEGAKLEPPAENLILRPLTDNF